ncbi:MAG: hypothetical protein HRT57_04430 [Crocinitomicaceae bacterium]|nr:hypothetical protein [Crocinitomicaceae bacterium]
MSEAGKSRVVGLLGIGFDNDDGHIRISHSEHSKIFMGSKESHHVLQQMCIDIEEAVRLSGRELSDYTSDEFLKLIQELY